ncbi:MAG: serine hydrolase [Chitinivibrionales bacterium]|nr:serine hydrolase [Chitinivibrionales bacterium]
MKKWHIQFSAIPVFSRRICNTSLKERKIDNHNCFLVQLICILMVTVLAGQGQKNIQQPPPIAIAQARLTKNRHEKLLMLPSDRLSLSGSVVQPTRVSPLQQFQRMQCDTAGRESSYWEKSAPESQGMDSKTLSRMIQSISQENAPVHSCMVIRNDHCLVEASAYPYQDTTLHNVKSVSKSILSALVGIALQERFLTSLDQTLGQFFPEYLQSDPDPRKAQITLRHLLTMTAGFNIDDESVEMQQIFSSADWVQAILQKPLKTQPGTVFCYSTCLTHLMAVILTKATKQPLLEFAQTYLFDPLDIHRVEWAQDPQGFYFGGAELKLTTAAMAKFGSLFLHDGLWGTRQVVPRQWVIESTTNQVAGVTQAPAYGYWWWIISESLGEFCASGWGGQIVSIIRSFNMVYVMTGSDQLYLPDIYYIHYVGPSIISLTEKLPPNPGDYSRLQQAIRQLSRPSLPKPPRPVPLAAKLVSGKKFTISGSPFQQISFSFSSPQAATLYYTTAAGIADSMKIGLAGSSVVSHAQDILGYSMSTATNTVAGMGKWINETTLSCATASIGIPLNYQMRFTFYGTWMEGTIHLPFLKELHYFYGISQ